MIIISILIFSIIVFRIILEPYKKTPNSYRKIEGRFCLISYAVIIYLAAFRGELVGADTLGYISDYADVNTMSFKDIAERYEGYLGYFYLSKLFTLMGMPIWVWFGFLELVLVSAVSRFINKYSRDRLYSILLFIVTGLFLFSLAGLKQTLAIAIMTHAYLEFIEKKYLRFPILVALAFTIHPVSMIMLLGFVFSLIGKKEVFGIVIISIVVIFAGGSLMTFSSLVSILGNEHFEIYLEQDNSYTMSTLYLYLLMLLCTLPYIKKYLRSDSHAKVEFACVLLLCLFQYMASFSPNLFRLALCYIPFLIVYTPNVFAYAKNSEYSTVLKYAALLGPIIFFLYSNRSFVYYTTFSLW